MHIPLPAPVEKTLTTLQSAGYDTYVVGGCVRDSMLGLIPPDWDISTAATPADITAVFSGYKVIETGIKHGTVTVIVDTVPLEITTFRIDGVYSDNRRPDSVEFTSDLELDLSRRDFTVNAMAYAPGRGVVDPFDGERDLRAHLIRCVGNPDARFDEDALRILRGLRFASVLDFEIEPATGESILSHRGLLNNVAAERIQKELVKLLCGKAVERVLLAYREVLFTILPALEAMNGFEQRGGFHCYDVYGHTVHTIACVAPEPELRVTMLLHDSGKPACAGYDEAAQSSCFHGHAAAGAEIAEGILKTLRFSNRFSAEVLTLVKNHDVVLFDNPKAVKKWLGKLGPTMFGKLLEVKRADTLALAEGAHFRIALLEDIRRQADALIADSACLTLDSLAVDGNDLKNIGIPAGKQIGEMLDTLFERVVDEQLPNTREALIAAAKAMM